MTEASQDENSRSEIVRFQSPGVVVDDLACGIRVGMGERWPCPGIAVPQLVPADPNSEHILILGG